VCILNLTILYSSQNLNLNKKRNYKIIKIVKCGKKLKPEMVLYCFLDKNNYLCDGMCVVL
jgi:hypothetical protein